MNRRSLLLGSVVASVTGILGVRAEQPITKLVTHTYAERSPDSVRMATMADTIRQSPEYQALLMDAIKGQMAMPWIYGENEWIKATIPEPHVITEKYAQANGYVGPYLQTDMPHWGLVKTGSDFKFVRITDS